MAKILPFIRDSLVNLVSGLGTMKDPTTAAVHVVPILSRAELEAAYRGNWLAKRIVNAVAEDATREWRLWQASDKQIEKIEQAEIDLDIQRKVRQTIMRARLYGGAALVLGVEQGDPEEELDIDSVKAGDLKFVLSVNCFDLAPGPMNWDAMSPWYGRPEYYTVTSRIEKATGELAMTRIHPSRVIPFTGHEVPDPTMNPMSAEWGDSVLVDVDEIIKDFGMVVGGLANMVNDAKMDVVKIPEFSKNIATKEYAERLFQRFTLANQAKSTVNTLLLDNEEEWERIQTAFSGLPNLLNEFLTVTSGAAGIPVSRLMGQSPGKALGNGTSGGEQDMRNYYDTIASMQKTMIGPTLAPLDKVLQAHALGSIDPNIFYEWAPLYQPDPMQLADIALKKAQTAAADVSMALINPDALRRARVNQLIEDGTYPGLEDAVDEFGEEPPEPEVDPNYDPTKSGNTGGSGNGGGSSGGGGGSGNKLEIVHSVSPTPVQDHRALPFVVADYDPDQLRAPKGSPIGGQWVKEKNAPSAVSFVSPNIEEGLDVYAATKGMQSLREQNLIKISDHIDKEMGLRSKSTRVVGAWRDGAEHSVMTEYKSTDFKSVIAAAAMKAYLADQKAVLVFQKNPKGNSYLLEFQAKGTLERVNKDMLEDGVAFHTLEPLYNKVGRVVGANVIVWASDKETYDAVDKGAQRYGSQIHYTRGDGQFLGTEKTDGTDREQRDDARRVYDEAIAGTGSSRIQEIWRDARAAYGQNLVTFGGLTPAENALSVLSILDPAYPSQPQRSRLVSDIARDLNARSSTALTRLGFRGGRIDGPSEKGDEMLARVLATEVQNGITREGATSSGWYSTGVSKAMQLAALSHPELSTDINAATAYRLAMAVTSQGEIVPRNADMTEEVYQYFKDNGGRFPTNVSAKKQEAMNSNFQKLNDLIDSIGMDRTREFLHTEFLAGDLQKMGYAIDENVDEKVYGSAILGAKIGQGFYQNLSGNYVPMTFDLWWMRGWGRLTGTLTDVVTPEGLVKQEKRLKDELKSAKHPVPRTADGLMAVAKDIMAVHEVDYRANKEDYKSKKKLKSELTLAAESFINGREGIKEQPANRGERKWMRSVGAKAIELLKSRGIDITPADLQAVWWYPEKHLYDKLGGRDSEGINVDYAGAMANIARRRGKSEDDIRRIMGS